MNSPNVIHLNGLEVRTQTTDFGEFLCLTDLAKAVGDHTGKILANWLRLIGTIEYLREWELKYNAAGFNVLGYEDIRMNAGTIRFSLSAQKWMEETGARGILSDAGRYGGTYAHSIIALEFCAAVSPAFKLGVFADYLELKEQNAQRWLKSYQFYLEKIENNTLEANQFARDLLDDARQQLQ